MKTAFVTGITGQDGAYLAASLLNKGYRVIGGHRRSSSQSFWRLAELGITDHEMLTIVDHDLTDLGSNIRALNHAEPDEVYNLAAQSFVRVSFDEPTTTAQISAVGALQLLEAVRIVNPKIRCYQASSAEMFGKVQAVPQDENTPFYPRSPYAVSKLFGHWSAINYRESYDMFASCGILFNHESPLRGPEFVTRKITQAAARISLGKQSVLKLGNLNAERDWGFAGEFVEGMWLMLQSDTPDTFVLATGVTTTVRDFATMAFAAAEIDLHWTGTGIDEVGSCRKTGRNMVEIDSAFYRPAEVASLIGSPAKAFKHLGWKPEVTVETLCQLMVAADIVRG
jgi:GDPmannose 4,6-dehydratase